MTAVRLVRLGLLLVIAASSVVIAVERRAQTAVREREDCRLAGLNFNRLVRQDDRRLGAAVAATCGLRDPTPGVRLIPYDDEFFGAPDPEPVSVPKYIGAISSVSASTLTLVERCDEAGTPLERTTVFRLADDAATTIPSAGDRSGTQQSTIEGLAAAARTHELWELTIDEGRVVEVFPWFLDACR